MVGGDPQAGGQGLILLHGNKGAADLGVHQAPGQKLRQHHKDQNKVVETHLACQHPPKQDRGRDAGDAGLSVGHLNPVEQDHVHDSGEQDRDDDKGAAPHPQTDGPQQEAHRCGHRYRRQQRRPPAETGLGHGDGKDIAADGVKPRLPQGHGAAVAQHDVQPLGRQNIDQRRHTQVLHILGAAQKGQQRQQRRPADKFFLMMAKSTCSHPVTPVSNRSFDCRIWQKCRWASPAGRSPP